MHLCLKLLCAKVSAPNRSFCARDFSLTVRDFWRAEQLRWVETNFEGWERLISARMRRKQLRRTYLDDTWEEMEWDEKSWDEVRRAHMIMIWDEMKCGVRSATVKCEARGVKNAAWSVKKVFAWRCIAEGSRAGHVLGRQHCNSFAQSTHARAWLVHGACKFSRWERSYSISLKQLPPGLVRALLVYATICIYMVMCIIISISIDI